MSATWGRRDAHWPRSAGRGGVFAHVGAAGFDPDGVVDDAVHNRVGVGPSAGSLVPVLLRVLGAEHRRGGVVAAFEQRSPARRISPYARALGRSAELRAM